MAILTAASLAVAEARESAVRIGAIDAVLHLPEGARPPIALLIAGSGPTDRDGNGPRLSPATLKKLAAALAARGIASLRYDKRGAGPWKTEFGRFEDFRFSHFVDDAAALLRFVAEDGRFRSIAVIGHSEGGLVAILAAQRVAVDRLVLLTTAGRRQGDLLKAQLQRQLAPPAYAPIAAAIDAIMAGRIVDPPPSGLSIPAALQPAFASAFVEDPITPLTKLGQPVLIVGGGRDRQVERQDFEKLTAARPSARQLWLPRMNHVLVDVGDDDDDLASYTQPERKLAAGLVEAIASFVTADLE